MARCPDCNKFVSLDSEQEPEISLDVGEDGQVTGTVEIANACADCGTELTQASFDVTVEATHIEGASGTTLASFIAGLDEAERDEIEFEVENEEGERTSRTEGKARGTRTFYGFIVRFDVVARREGQDDVTFSGSFEDEIQASSMDVV